MKGSNSNLWAICCILSSRNKDINKIVSSHQQAYNLMEKMICKVLVIIAATQDLYI